MSKLAEIELLSKGRYRAIKEMYEGTSFLVGVAELISEIERFGAIAQECHIERDEALLWEFVDHLRVLTDQEEVFQYDD